MVWRMESAAWVLSEGGYERGFLAHPQQFQRRGV